MRDDIVAYSNDLLQIKRFKDYCPNGLQVEGKTDIQRIVSAVTASEAVIQEAIAHQADVLLVHHGYFWKGEDLCITSMKRKRLALLLQHDINLLAYHIPLDMHPALGNGIQLGKILGFEVSERFDMPEWPGIGCVANLAEPIISKALKQHMASCLSREPLHIVSSSDQLIRRIGWVTGAAQDAIKSAVEAGCDAYVSGEVSERTYYEAKELDIHYFAAGHHATERYGVQALGEHLAQRFSLEHSYIESGNVI
jgi:dinuclear metal center YbgI/SA1388 family protein